MAASTRAVIVLRYSAGFIEWYLNEFEEIGNECLNCLCKMCNQKGGKCLRIKNWEKLNTSVKKWYNACNSNIEVPSCVFCKWNEKAATNNFK